MRVPPWILLLPTSLLLPLHTSAHAQGPTFRLTSATQTGAFARNGSTTRLQTTPPGRPINHTRHSAAVGRDTGAEFLLGANATSDAIHLNFEHLSHVTAGAAGTTQSTDQNSIVPGPVGLRMVVLPGRSPRGTLILSFHATPRGNASLRARVDVGDDRSIEFDERIAGSGTRSRFMGLRVAVPAAGLPIRFDVEALASAQGNVTAGYLGVFRIHYYDRDRASTLTDFGAACGASSQAVSVPLANRNAIQVSFRTALPDALGVTVLGGRQSQVAIGNCTLLTLPLVTIPFVVNPAGDSLHAFDLPVIQGLTVHMQDLAIDRAFTRIVAGQGITIRYP